MRAQPTAILKAEASLDRAVTALRSQRRRHFVGLLVALLGSGPLSCQQTQGVQDAAPADAVDLRVPRDAPGTADIPAADGGVDGSDPVVGRACGLGASCPCGYFCPTGRCEVAEFHPPCDLR